jgi:uncharacterized protein GlcG (DUF336 family)
MRSALRLGLAVALSLAGASATAQPASGPAPPAPTRPPYGAPIDLARAKAVLAAAEAEARRQGWTMAIAVVEPTGDLVAFEKIDGTQYGSVQVAQDKARTAALFRRASREFAEGLQTGSLGALSLRGVTAVEGGVPIVAGGRIVGAIGVSGGSSAQDGVVARAGADALR